MGELRRTGDKASRLKLSSAKELRKYTQQIWLAGLGAFARAEDEGGKLFENLVRTGEELDAKTRERGDIAFEDVRERVREVRERATDAMEKVERVFDDRLAGALGRLGIPSQKDIELLHARMDALMEQMERLTAASAPKPSRSRGGHSSSED